MLYRTMYATLAVLALTSLSAFGDTKDDLMAAVNKTADAPSYSWTQNVEGGFGAGQSSGKTEKDGYTWAELPGRNGSTEVILKGKKAVIKTDNGWQTPEEMTAAAAAGGGGGGGGGGGPGRFIAQMVQNYQTPIAQAQETLKGIQNVKADGDSITGNLSEDAAKQMMTFRRGGRRGGGAAGGGAAGGGAAGGGAAAGGGGAPAGPQVTNAKVEVHAWTKDGQITKLQYHQTGTMSFNGNDNDIDRTTTIEIKDVGSTKIDVPADAKKKLEG